MPEAQPQTQSHVTPERIMQFAFGYAPPLMLAAAIRHRVFDVLDSGPKTLEQVGQETGASLRGLRGIMNALVSLGFLAKDGDGRYALTPESAAFLVSGTPAFLGGLLQHTTAQILPAWMQMNEVVRTGLPSLPVNREEGGSEFFEAFVEALFPMSYPGARALGDALGLANTTQSVRVLDVAAGSGVWGIGLAQKSPNVRVTALDWPGVVRITKRVAARMGVADRFDYIEGDLMVCDFGQGYHVVTLGHILHSEGIERSRALLTKVFAALAPGGTIAIAEMLANEERTGPPHAMIFAVNMLVATEQGDTYSFSEISGWLREAGFQESRMLEAPGPSPLILATKPA